MFIHKRWFKLALNHFLFNKYINEVVLKVTGKTKVLDKGSIELVGPFGLEKGLTDLSYSISKLDTGSITSYAVYILLGLIAYITIPFLGNYSPIIILLVGLVFLSKNETIIKPNAFVTTPLKSNINFKSIVHSFKNKEIRNSILKNAFKNYLSNRNLIRLSGTIIAGILIRALIFDFSTIIGSTMLITYNIGNFLYLVLNEIHLP